MKKILSFIVCLLAHQAIAQTFYYKKFSVPTGVDTSHFNYPTYAPMADGSVMFGHYQDSLAYVVKIDAHSGQVVKTKIVNGFPSSALTDSGVYTNDTWFYATQDTGIVLVFRRISFRNPASSGDTDRVVMVKLDKELNIQWSRTRVMPDSGGNDYYSIGCVASDIAGNTYCFYSRTNERGIAKISPTGTILASKNITAEFGGWLYAIGDNRLLASFSVLMNGTGRLYNYVLNDQLQITRANAYNLNGIRYIGNVNFLPAYHQSLIAGTIIERTQQGGGTADTKDCIFIMDTTGSLLKFARYTGGATGNNWPLWDASISADNKLAIVGNGSSMQGQVANFLHVSDTALNTIFTKSFSHLQNTIQIAPLIQGSDLFLPSYSESGYGNYLSDDVMYADASGSDFCAVSDTFGSITFTDLSVATVSQSIPAVNPGNFTLQPVVLDTLPVSGINTTTLCTALGIETLPNLKQQVFVTPTGKNQLQVTTSSSFGKSSFELRDISGRLMYRGQIHDQKETLTVPDIAAGIYIWNVYGQSGQRDAGKLFLQ